MIKTIFKRYENKYILNERQYQAVLRAIEGKDCVKCSDAAVSVNASDDGINAAGGNDSPGGMGGQPDRGMGGGKPGGMMR